MEKIKKTEDYFKHSFLTLNTNKKTILPQLINIYNMEKQFITKEEKATLESLRQSEEQIVIGLGQLEYQIQTILFEKENMITSLSKLREEQNIFGGTLTEAYGDGNIDITTGEFIKA